MLSHNIVLHNLLERWTYHVLVGNEDGKTQHSCASAPSKNTEEGSFFCNAFLALAWALLAQSGNFISGNVDHRGVTGKLKIEKLAEGLLPGSLGIEELKNWDGNEGSIGRLLGMLGVIVVAEAAGDGGGSTSGFSSPARKQSCWVRYTPQPLNMGSSRCRGMR
jgi:hypothetical protein